MPSSKPPGFPGGDESLSKALERPDRLYKRNWGLLGETAKKMRDFMPTPAGWPAEAKVAKVPAPKIAKLPRIRIPSVQHQLGLPSQPGGGGIHGWGSTKLSLKAPPISAPHISTVPKHWSGH